MRLYYMSIVQGEKAAGVVVLRAPLDGANTVLTDCEVLLVDIEDAPERALYEANAGRLIPPEEARTLFDAKSIREHDAEEDR